MRNTTYLAQSAAAQSVPESMRAAFSRAYIWHRQHGATPSAANARAFADVEARKGRWPEYVGAGIGAADESGLRWIERPEKAGLRFVGFADEISGVDHLGWHTDPHGDGETYRGAVYQLPARNGRPRFVPAYRHGSYNFTSRHWQDLNGEAIRVDLSDVRDGEPAAIWESATDDPEARSCAYTADSIAERAAESERDYQTAWQEGSRYADLLEQATAAHERARSLVAGIREHVAAVAGNPCATPNGGAIRATLKQAVRGSLETWRDNRREARELRDEWRPDDLAAAFADGAGLAA